MNKPNLQTITVIWYIAVACASLPLVLFIGYMLFYFMFSGFDGSEPDPLFLIAAVVPVAVIIYVSHLLRKQKLKQEKQNMRDELLKEQQSATVTFSPETAILAALKQKSHQKLSEVAQRTGITESDVLHYIAPLISSGKITKQSGLEGIFYSTAS